MFDFRKLVNNAFLQEISKFFAVIGVIAFMLWVVSWSNLDDEVFRARMSIFQSAVIIVFSAIWFFGLIGTIAAFIAKPKDKEFLVVALAFPLINLWFGMLLGFGKVAELLDKLGDNYLQRAYWDNASYALYHAQDNALIDGASSLLELGFLSCPATIMVSLVLTILVYDKFQKEITYNKIYKILKLHICACLMYIFLYVSFVILWNKYGWFNFAFVESAYSKNLIVAYAVLYLSVIYWRFSRIMEFDILFPIMPVIDFIKRVKNKHA